LSRQFHHIGVACENLDSEARKFALLGYTAEGADFIDPVQGVMGRFLAGGGPRLELLAPLPGGGTLTPWLRAGVKLYHLCYETDEFEKELEQARLQRAKVVVQPVPAVAFGGRRIAFLIFPNMLLVEFIAQG